MGGGGYDIGASLSGSASSGASESGAIDASGGGNFGGRSYGPGSVVQLTNDSGVALSTPVVIGALAALAFVASRMFGK